MFVTILVASLMLYGVYLAIRPDPVVYDPYPGYVQARRTSSTTTKRSTINPFMWTKSTKFRPTTTTTTPTTSTTTEKQCATEIGWEYDTEMEYYYDEDAITTSTTQNIFFPWLPWIGRLKRNEEKNSNEISKKSNDVRNSETVKSSNHIEKSSKHNKKIPPNPQKVARRKKRAKGPKKNVGNKIGRKISLSKNIRRGQRRKVKRFMTAPPRQTKRHMLKQTTHSLRDVRKRRGGLYNTKKSRKSRNIKV